MTYTTFPNATNVNGNPQATTGQNTPQGFGGATGGIPTGQPISGTPLQNFPGSPSQNPYQYQYQNQYQNPFVNSFPGSFPAATTYPTNFHGYNGFNGFNGFNGPTGFNGVNTFNGWNGGTFGQWPTQIPTGFNGFNGFGGHFNNQFNGYFNGQYSPSFHGWTPTNTTFPGFRPFGTFTNTFAQYPIWNTQGFGGFGGSYNTPFNTFGGGNSFGGQTPWNTTPWNTTSWNSTPWNSYFPWSTPTNWQNTFGFGSIPFGQGFSNGQYTNGQHANTGYSTNGSVFGTPFNTTPWNGSWNGSWNGTWNNGYTPTTFGYGQTPFGYTPSFIGNNTTDGFFGGYTPSFQGFGGYGNTFPFTTPFNGFPNSTNGWGYPTFNNSYPTSYPTGNFVNTSNFPAAYIPTFGAPFFANTFGQGFSAGTQVSPSTNIHPGAFVQHAGDCCGIRQAA